MIELNGTTLAILLLVALLIGVFSRNNQLAVQPRGGSLLSILALIGLGLFFYPQFMSNNSNNNNTNVRSVANRTQQNNSSGLHFKFKSQAQPSYQDQQESQFSEYEADPDQNRAGPDVGDLERDLQQKRRVNQPKMVYTNYSAPEQHTERSRLRDVQRSSQYPPFDSKADAQMSQSYAYTLQLTASSNLDAILNWGQELKATFPNLEPLLYAPPRSGLKKLFLGEYASERDMQMVKRQVDRKLGISSLPVSYTKQEIDTDYLYTLE